jgi:hypothetical protein
MKQVSGNFARPFRGRYTNINKREKIMFCSKCGNQVEEGVQFCSKCGNKLSASPDDARQSTNENKPQQQQIMVVMPTGTAPLILGLLGIFGFLIPIVKYFTGIMSLIAIFLGAGERGKLKKVGLPSGKATAGLVLGILAVMGTLISIISTGLFLGSLAKTMKPKKPEVYNVKLYGNYVAGKNFRYLYDFSGNTITTFENKNYKLQDSFAVYIANMKGTYERTPYVNNTDKLIVTFTHEWKDKKWQELEKEKTIVYYMEETDSLSFSLKDNGSFKEYFSTPHFSISKEW